MPPDYTILPSGSATLRYSINNTGIYDSLRGINTKACMVGARALQFDLLLLIEFRPAGLWPFIRLPQQELLDNSFSFSDLHARLNSRISEALLTSETISAFIERLSIKYCCVACRQQRTPAAHTSDNNNRKERRLGRYSADFHRCRL